MGSAAGKFQHLQSFQPDLLRASRLKEPKPAAKQHRHQVKVQLIGQSGAEALLDGPCAADHRNIFIACRPFGLRDDAFNTVSHKGEG